MDGPQTTLTSINASGEIVGFSGSIAFVREPDGTITQFGLDNYALWPTSINNAGYVAGSAYQGANEIGFIRDPGGTITTFMPPGALTTQVTGINASQTATGFTTSADFIRHGFVRQSDGTITTFDLDDALQTLPAAINDAGTVAGSYIESSGSHGFLRDAKGTITIFDVSNTHATEVRSINANGWVTGIFGDLAGQHSFLRSPAGVFTTFGNASVGLDARCVNNAGIVAGMSKKSRGFIRAAKGKISYFKVPGDKIHRTSAVCLNDGNVVIGTYYQVTGPHTGTQIGFIRSQ
jgi:hypothetical protein